MFFAPPHAIGYFAPPSASTFFPCQDQQRVYVTSLANIASSSPSKQNWSQREDGDEPQTNPARKFFARILHRRRNDDVTEIVDDSINISDSKRLQLSIIAEQGTTTTNREIYCCSTDEGDCVIRMMKSTASSHLSEGSLKDALHTLNKCLALQQKLNGKESVEVADTLHAMGTIMANMGTEYNYRAMTAFEQALKIYQEKLGFGSEEAAACLKNLYLLLHKERVCISIMPCDEEDDTAVSCHECYTCTEATRNPL